MHLYMPHGDVWVMLLYLGSMCDASIHGDVWVMLLYLGCMGDATIPGDVCVMLLYIEVYLMLLYMWLYG